MLRGETHIKVEFVRAIKPAGNGYEINEIRAGFVVQCILDCLPVSFFLEKVGQRLNGLTQLWEMIRTVALLLIVEEAFDNVEHIKEVIEIELRLRYVANQHRKRSQRLVIMVVMLPEEGLGGIRIEKQEIEDDIPARIP